jgi:DNA polymerase-3 subunit epsilon
VGIVERDRGREAAEVHVVDRWCYLGTAGTDAELAELLEQARAPRFDYDHYRILSRHLARQNVRTLALPACTAS